MEHALAAAEEPTGIVHLFAVTRADQSVPRRASPIASVSPPGMGPSLAPAGQAGGIRTSLPPKLGFVANSDDGDSGALLVASWAGCCVLGARCFLHS